jgi:thiol-disulfide isomerase/thioredoxin
MTRALALLFASTLGCTSLPSMPDAPRSDVAPDAPAADPDAGGRDAPAASDAGTDVPSACVPPAGPYGTSVGDTLAPLSLPLCDGRAYAFYDASFCDPSHAATVVMFSAIWCTVCQSESAELIDRIVTPYRDRGVRVVQILVDGAVPGAAVTAGACATWRDTFGLGDLLAYDADGAMTAAHHPEGMFPVTLVVDEAGVIRYRDVHGELGLAGLAAALDDVLGP